MGTFLALNSALSWDKLEGTGPGTSGRISDGQTRFASNEIGRVMAECWKMLPN